MLTRLQAFARRLQPIRFLLLIIAVLACCGAGYILITSRTQAGDLYLIPLMALFAWAVMLYAFATLFVRVPPRPERSMKWRSRCRIRLVRVGYWLTAVSMLAVSVFLLLTTWSLATAWRMAY